MATARQRAEWERIGTLAWAIRVAVWGKEPMTSETVVPEQFRAARRPARELTEEEKTFAKRVFWAKFDSLSR